MNDMTLQYAPICLFAYNRLDELKQTVNHLKRNYLASKSELYIFLDGAKKKTDEKKIKEISLYVKQINGFSSVTVYEAKENKGLGKSIISGVSEVIQKYGRIIVLEDDLITSSNFLTFMNQALDFYKDTREIFSISGYSMPLRLPKDYDSDYYYSVRASSWGWATWKDRWENIDWDIKDFKSFIKSTKMQRSFNKGGSELTRMLKNQMNGKINSWAIRWCYNQWKLSMYTVYPRISKVKNIGFQKAASHTKYRIKEFDSVLDPGDDINFLFSKEVSLNQQIIKAFRWHYSIPVRLKNKIINLLQIPF